MKLAKQTRKEGPPPLLRRLPQLECSSASDKFCESLCRLFEIIREERLETPAARDVDAAENATEFATLAYERRANPDSGKYEEGRLGLAEPLEEGVQMKIVVSQIFIRFDVVMGSTEYYYARLRPFGAWDAREASRKEVWDPWIVEKHVAGKSHTGMFTALSRYVAGGRYCASSTICELALWNEERD